MMNHGNMDMDHENGTMMSKNDSGMGHMMKVSILPFGFIFGSRGVSAFPEIY